MEIIRSRQNLDSYISNIKNQSKKIGFVPTMGALHLGHISLCEAALNDDNDIVVSSIFVNPTQFNNSEDLEKYPRTEEKDLQMLEKAGIHAVYIPKISDMYPGGVIRKNYNFDGIENEMEGKFRLGHFDGVGTVVSELFRQIMPNNAYFGEKDYQQLVIIRKLVNIETMCINIHEVPIYREPNGLAMSSRNMRLSSENREKASVIYKTLKMVDDWFPTVDYVEIKQKVENIFLQTKFNLEYFIIADEETLKEADFFYKNKNYRAFIAVFVGNVRLIDNMKLNTP